MQNDHRFIKVSNPTIQKIVDRTLDRHFSYTQTEPLDVNKFSYYLAKEVAEYCAGVCEEMATKVAGCESNLPTIMADSCATMIRTDFEIDHE